MHSASTVQCELVCFSGGNFANPVISQLKHGTCGGHQSGGHELELLPLLARHLLVLVVWAGAFWLLLVAFPTPNSLFSLFDPPPIPPSLPPSHPPPH